MLLSFHSMIYMCALLQFLLTSHFIGFTVCYDSNVKTLTAHCYEYHKVYAKYDIQTYDLDSLVNGIVRAGDYKSVYHADVPCFKAKNNSFNAKVLHFNLYCYLIYLLFYCYYSL